MKVWQVTPDNAAPDVYTTRYDIKNKNHVVGTVTYCATLERFEKNAPDMIQTLCHGVEVAAVEAQCHALHPGMKMTPLKLPPRTSRDEIACQWEFRIEE